MPVRRRTVDLKRSKSVRSVSLRMKLSLTMRLHLFAACVGSLCFQSVNHVAYATDKGLGYLIQWHGDVNSTGFEGGARHAVDGTGFFVLRDAVAALSANSLCAQGPVSPHAGEHDPQYARTEFLCR